MRSEADDRLDEATARRLAKLRTMPVDTSRLDKGIAARIPHAQPGYAGFRLSRFTPLRAVAASIVVLVMAGAILWSLSGGAVLASPDAMARFHEDLVSGKVHATQVDSIAEANTVLADQWRRRVEIPHVPSEHVMLCCMQSIEDKQVACVLLRSDGGVPITMAVAKSMDMKLPKSNRVWREGATYHVQSSGNLNMVMTERDGRYICLIGAVSQDDLIAIGEGIGF